MLKAKRQINLFLSEDIPMPGGKGALAMPLETLR